MPPLNFLRRLPGYLSPNGLDDDDIDPAELEQVRRALPPWELAAIQRKTRQVAQPGGSLLFTGLLQLNLHFLFLQREVEFQVVPFDRSRLRQFRYAIKALFS